MEKWYPWMRDNFLEGAPLTRDRKVGLDSWSWQPYGGNPDYRDTLYNPDEYQGDAYHTAPWIYQEIPNSGQIQASLPDRIEQFLSKV